MLDPWIIEEILRREQEQQHERERSHLELPLEAPNHREERSKAPDEESHPRGVIVIDI